MVTLLLFLGLAWPRVIVVYIYFDLIVSTTVRACGYVCLLWIAFPLRGLYPDRTWGVFYACLLASVLSVVLLLCTGAAAAVKLALKAKKV